MIATTADRVPLNTAEDVNRAIRERTDRSIAYYSHHPEEIPPRLRDLQREWDVERALATGSSCLSLLGLALASSRGRRCLLLPFAVQSFYLQHTLQGWCPPLPLFRRLGFRTPAEIERERNALKDALREMRRPPPEDRAAAADAPAIRL
jgi:hypothetical protein